MKEQTKRRAADELENLCVAVTALLAVVTVLGRLDVIEPMLDNLTNFCAFYAAGAVLSLPMLLARRNLSALLAAAVLVLNVIPVARFYVPQPAPAVEHTLKVSTYNFYGTGGDIDKLLAEMSRADSDIVFVCELTRAARDRLRESYPQMVWNSDAPYQTIISKFPVVSSTVGEMGGRDYRDVVVETPAGELRVLGVHAMVPLWGHLTTVRNQGLRELADVAAASDLPVVALGDFNITMFSPHYAPLESSLTNVREGRGVQGTWPSWLPVHIPIDHILVSDQLVGLALEVGHNIESDHLPLHATLGFQ